MLPEHMKELAEQEKMLVKRKEAIEDGVAEQPVVGSVDIAYVR